MNKETLYKQKVQEYIEAAGWHENRKEEVISDKYSEYNYPENVDKLYREFLHLDIWNCFEGEKNQYPEKIIHFDEWGIIHTQEDYRASDEYFFSQVIKKKLYYIGSSGNEYICVDEDLYFYTVNEWGIEFWGYSFHVGLYNYMFFDTSSPDFVRYRIPFIDFNPESYKKNSKGKIIWYNRIKNDKDEILE